MSASNDGLHGIPELSCDGQGYIYWKGHQVEHYDKPRDESMATPARELARRCRLLEKRGKPINTTTAIWAWDESGNGDKWEIAFDDCNASSGAKRAAKRICQAYGIKGLCDPAYIANVIQTEAKS
jgi:hypothetical protein